MEQDANPVERNTIASKDPLQRPLGKARNLHCFVLGYALGPQDIVDRVAYAGKWLVCSGQSINRRFWNLWAKMA